MTRWIAIAAGVAWCGVTALAAEPVVVSEAGRDAKQPQAAVAEDGTIYVAYGSGESLFVCRSEDRGTRYSEPVRVGRVKDLMLGMRRGPRIAAAGDRVVVTAIGRAGSLMCWRSADGGRAWEGPVTINDGPSSAREGLHDLAAGPEGELFCVWLDLRGGRQMELWGARSEDSGRTWSRNRLIYRSPDGHICECCHPSVRIGRDHPIYVMWRNWLDGSRDMYLSASRDGGESFGPALKLGEGTWKLDHCPMDGGYLAVTGDGEVVTIWRRDKEIFRTHSGTGTAIHREDHIGRGEQPWATATSAGVYYAWISGRPGDLWLTRPEKRRAVKVAEDAADPVLAAPLTGKGPVVLLWESGKGREKEIRAMVVAGR